MSKRCPVPAIALAAIGLSSASASAGLVGGSNHSIDLMQIASGFVDLADPSASTFTDLTSVAVPPVGSYLNLQGVIPGNRSFLGDLEFISCDGVTSVFDFEFAVQSVPFDSTGFEFFFAGGRLDIVSEVEFSVRLDALVGGSGGGLAFLYDYDNEAPHLFFPSSEPVDFILTFGPGMHRIAWGALVDPTGGEAGIDGSIVFTFVPAPGAVALLALAGFAVSRRRRA
jgi:hypothetical protein